MPLSQTSLLTCSPHWLTKALGHSPVKRSGPGPVGQDPCHAVSEPGRLPVVDVAKIRHTQRQQVQRVVHQNVVPHHTGLIQVSNMDKDWNTKMTQPCLHSTASRSPFAKLLGQAWHTSYLRVECYILCYYMLKKRERKNSQSIKQCFILCLFTSRWY